MVERHVYQLFVTCNKYCTSFAAKCEAAWFNIFILTVALEHESVREEKDREMGGYDINNKDPQLDRKGDASVVWYILYAATIQLPGCTYGL